MDPEPSSITLTLEPSDNRRLASLCGQFDEHLRQMERRLNVEISNRGNRFQIVGSDPAPRRAGEVLQDLYEATERAPLTPERVHLCLQQAGIAEPQELEHDDKELLVHARRCVIKPRSPHQKTYISNILDLDLSFGVGPAGTGKTYLAVACAVQAL